MVNFIKWTEESLVKVPITDIIFGSVGLVFGLIVAFLIGFALTAIEVPIVNTIAPILLTLLFGYLGFQVGFKKRDELLGLLANKKKKTGDEEPEKENKNALKILDTSVIIDGTNCRYLSNRLFRRYHCDSPICAC